MMVECVSGGGDIGMTGLVETATVARPMGPTKGALSVFIALAIEACEALSFLATDES